MAKHKIAIVVGSLRAGSVNRKVAKSICSFASDTLDCTIVEIGDLPLYNQDNEANPPESVVRFRLATISNLPADSNSISSSSPGFAPRCSNSFFFRVICPFAVTVSVVIVITSSH